MVLQRQWREESVRTGASSNEVIFLPWDVKLDPGVCEDYLILTLQVSTLEADDSRTGDDSIVGGTPVVVKKVCTVFVTLLNRWYIAFVVDVIVPRKLAVELKYVICRHVGEVGARQRSWGTEPPQTRAWRATRIPRTRGR